jgi:hypothetical protein
VKKKHVLAMFYVLFVLKNFFDPNLRGGSRKIIFLNFGENMEKIWKNYGKIGKIWHRGNFSPNVVIYETGCGNFP